MSTPVCCIHCYQKHQPNYNTVKKFGLNSLDDTLNLHLGGRMVCVLVPVRPEVEVSSYTVLTKLSTYQAQ